MNLPIQHPARGLALAGAVAGLCRSVHHILEPVLVGGNQPFFAAAPSGFSWMVGTEKSSQMTLADDANGPRTPAGLGGGSVAGGMPGNVSDRE